MVPVVQQLRAIMYSILIGPRLLHGESGCGAALVTGTRAKPHTARLANCEKGSAKLRVPPNHRKGGVAPRQSNSGMVISPKVPCEATAHPITQLTTRQQRRCGQFRDYMSVGWGLASGYKPLGPNLKYSPSKATRVIAR